MPHAPALITSIAMLRSILLPTCALSLVVLSGCATGLQGDSSDDSSDGGSSGDGGASSSSTSSTSTSTSTSTTTTSASTSTSTSTSTTTTSASTSTSTTASTTSTSTSTGASTSTGSPCAEDCASLAAPACQEFSCNPTTAQCELADLADGTLCNDADDCTSGDACASGACQGTSNGTCSACAESEVNDVTAMADSTQSCTIVTGTISVAGDVDCFAVDVPAAGARIEATVVDVGGSGCPTGFDSYLRLYNPAGTEIATDDDGAGGFATCSKLSSTTPGTKNLSAGLHTLCVEEFLNDEVSPPYGLIWSVTTPMCGDGLVEGVEQCEGTNVGGATCVTAGYASGTVACDAANCKLDATGCSMGTCNGAQLEYGEDCDGQAFCSAQCALFECPAGQTAFEALGAGLPTDILDNDTATSSALVSAMGTITQLAVQVDLTHTYDGDLELTLAPPVGAPVTLASFVGGTGENFRATVFSSKATVAIATGAAPFQGVFLPLQSLAGLTGANANGAWRLDVLDDAFGDEGKLVGWRVFGCAQP